MEANRKPSILIADDVPENIKILINALEEDYRLIVATNGKQALELATSDVQPDLILLDVMMPLMDGFEVCQKLRSDEKYANIPIIFLTAKSGVLDETRGLELGAVDYITKPFRVAVVKARVKSQLERKRAIEALVKMERLEAVADLAAGVAHHFNNMLQVVMSGASVGSRKSRQGDTDAVEAILQQIVDYSQFGVHTVRRLEEFVKMGGGHSERNETFDLSNTSQQAIETTTRTWKTEPERRGIDISLVRKLLPNCAVEGKESELFQVITNLIRNSVEAMPEGGELVVETTLVENRVVVRVADTGIGIPQENLGKIFEPFFTTKGFQRVGMGLPTCYGIVNNHGGSISVESELGRGSVFSVSLPVSRKIPTDVNATQTHSMGKALRILAVDDVEPITMMLSELLSEFGHEVVSSLSGEDALRMFSKESIDLVICDLGMPGMSGWEVGKRMKQICEERGTPKAPFVLLTGWAGQLDQETMIVECGVDAVVKKPVDSERLRSLIQELVCGITTEI